jgi:uncharacterized membrane protein YgdD (TMEM256/DUF423 family)
MIEFPEGSIMKTWLFIASVNGALAVLAGAFAAHALGQRLDVRALATFTTGAHYHLIHAVAMGVAALAIRGAARSRAAWAAGLFLAGILLFSGSLYMLALTGVRTFAYVTPLGGIAFVLGWAMLAWAALKLEET